MNAIHQDSLKALIPISEMDIDGRASLVVSVKNLFDTLEISSLPDCAINTHIDWVLFCTTKYHELFRDSFITSGEETYVHLYDAMALIDVIPSESLNKVREYLLETGMAHQNGLVLDPLNSWLIKPRIKRPSHNRFKNLIPITLMELNSEIHFVVSGLDIYTALGVHGGFMWHDWVVDSCTKHDFIYGEDFIRCTSVFDHPEYYIDIHAAEIISQEPNSDNSFDVLIYLITSGQDCLLEFFVEQPSDKLFIDLMHYVSNRTSYLTEQGGHGNEDQLVLSLYIHYGLMSGLVPLSKLKSEMYLAFKEKFPKEG